MGSWVKKSTFLLAQEKIPKPKNTIAIIDGWVKKHSTFPLAQEKKKS